jgi:hypothetical protein
MIETLIGLGAIVLILNRIDHNRKVRQILLSATRKSSV